MNFVAAVVADRQVVARASFDQVIVPFTVKFIVAAVTENHVVTCGPKDNIVAKAAVQFVGQVGSDCQGDVTIDMAEYFIVPTTRIDKVSTTRSDNQVVTATRFDIVVAVSPPCRRRFVWSQVSVDNVVARSAKDFIARSSSDDRVVACSAIDVVRECGAVQVVVA